MNCGDSGHEFEVLSHSYFVLVSSMIPYFRCISGPMNEYAGEKDPLAKHYVIKGSRVTHVFSYRLKSQNVSTKLS